MNIDNHRANLRRTIFHFVGIKLQIAINNRINLLNRKALTDDEFSSLASPKFCLVDIYCVNRLRPSVNSYHQLSRTLLVSFASFPSTAFIQPGCSCCILGSSRTDLSHLRDLCLSHSKRCSYTRSEYLGTKLQFH